jgi:hypothetical protein
MREWSPAALAARRLRLLRPGRTRSDTPLAHPNHPAVRRDRFPQLPSAIARWWLKIVSYHYQMETMIICYFLKQPIDPTSLYHLATLEGGTSDNRRIA